MTPEAKREVSGFLFISMGGGVMIGLGLALVITAFGLSSRGEPPAPAAAASGGKECSQTLNDFGQFVVAAAVCRAEPSGERNRPGSACVAEITYATRKCHVARKCPDAKDVAEAVKLSALPPSECDEPCDDLRRGLWAEYGIR